MLLHAAVYEFVPHVCDFDQLDPAPAASLHMLENVIPFNWNFIIIHYFSVQIIFPDHVTHSKQPFGERLC